MPAGRLTRRGTGESGCRRRGLYIRVAAPLRVPDAGARAFAESIPAHAYTRGDDQDTTTVQALARTLAWCAVGDGLEADDQNHLVTSMIGARTGEHTIRAGLPAGWTVANRTGTGSHGTRNDVAVLWPDNGSGPIVLAMLTLMALQETTSSPMPPPSLLSHLPNSRPSRQR